MKETSTGKILTAALIGTGIYLGVKNYKSTGFWYGVAALFLVGCSVTTFKTQ